MYFNSIEIHVFDYGDTARCLNATLLWCHLTTRELDIADTGG
jgi:hypothetical protein